MNLTLNILEPGIPPAVQGLAAVTILAPRLAQPVLAVANQLGKQHAIADRRVGVSERASRHLWPGQFGKRRRRAV